jgi:hypothetical protein
MIIETNYAMLKFQCILKKTLNSELIKNIGLNYAIVPEETSGKVAEVIAASIAGNLYRSQADGSLYWHSTVVEESAVGNQMNSVFAVNRVLMDPINKWELW